MNDAPSPLLPSPSGPLLVGVVHVPPLPGSPRSEGIDNAVRAALTDAAALVSGGMNALIVENYGDAPFFKESVPPVTVAALTRVATLLREAHPDVPLGSNVLRNDAAAAVSIATVVGARFVRVNVHTGSAYTDQGWIEGKAAETLRLRAQLGGDVAIYADVAVKHATLPPGFDLAQSARDCAARGGADALIVTGNATGAAIDTGTIDTVRDAVGAHPIIVGSGVDVENASVVLAKADGAIVGTSLKRDGRVGAPVDVDRVRRLVAAVRD